MKTQMEFFRSWQPRSWVVVSGVFTAGLLCAWTLAEAEDFSQRWYLNGGVGATHVEPESTSDALAISDNNDSGGHLAIGFDVNRFLTVEGYVADLGQAQVEFLDTPAGEVDYQVFGISALGYLLNSRSGLSLGDSDSEGLFRREGASLYGRIGLGHMSNDSQVNYHRDYPNHVAYGLGLEYGFKNGFALRSELMTMDTDAKYWNIGILKRFGSASAAPVAAAALPVAAQEKVNPAPAAVQSQPKEVVQEEPIVFKPIVPPTTYFDFDESTIDEAYARKLDEFAGAVSENDLQLSIEGHTDWIAPESYNMSLSVRRAEAVANYLIGKGVDSDRITTIGYGELRPISDNDTEQGRALNRRTEIQLQRALALK